MRKGIISSIATSRRFLTSPLPVAKDLTADDSLSFTEWALLLSKSLMVRLPARQRTCWSAFRLGVITFMEPKAQIHSSVGIRDSRELVKASTSNRGSKSYSTAHLEVVFLFNQLIHCAEGSCSTTAKRLQLLVASPNKSAALGPEITHPSSAEQYHIVLSKIRSPSSLPNIST